MCVRLHSENSEATVFFSKTMPDDLPPTPLPCRWPALVTLPTLAKVQLILAPPVMCCFPPASSSTPLWPSVCYPSISLVVSIMYIRIFCHQLSALYSFDSTCIVLKSGWSSTARITRLVVSPPSLSPSAPPTPPPSRWPALTTLPPSPSFSSFGAACVKFCCLPPRWSEIPVSSVSSA